MRWGCIKEGDGVALLAYLSSSETYSVGRNLESVRRGRSSPIAAISQENTARHFSKAIENRIPGAIMSETPKALLLSLKPRFADLIFEGVKRAELRRRSLVQMEGREVFVYVTSPIMMLRGGFRVGAVWTGTPQDIWDKVSEWAGVDKDDFERLLRRSIDSICSGDHRRLGIRKPAGTQHVEEPIRQLHRSAVLAVCNTRRA